MRRKWLVVVVAFAVMVCITQGGGCKDSKKKKVSKVTVTVIDERLGTPVVGAAVRHGIALPVLTDASGVAVLDNGVLSINTITVTKATYQPVTVADYAQSVVTIAICYENSDLYNRNVINVAIAGLADSDNNAAGFLSVSTGADVDFGGFVVLDCATVPSPIQMGVMPGLPTSVLASLIPHSPKIGYELIPAGITANNTTVDITLVTIDLSDTAEFTNISGVQAVPTLSGNVSEGCIVASGGITSSGMFIVLGFGEWSSSNGEYSVGVPYLADAANYGVIFMVESKDDGPGSLAMWRGTWNALGNLGDNPVTFMSEQTLTTPTNGSVATGGVLTWATVAGADYYRVEVEGPTGDGFVAYAFTTSFTIPLVWGLSTGDDCMWSVAAVNSRATPVTNFNTDFLESAQEASSGEWEFTMP